MKQPQNIEPHPESNDIDGWRRAVKEERLSTFPLEAIVAAIQDLGVNSDIEVINALAQFLSLKVLDILEGKVRKSYPNKGDDIVQATHYKIIESVLSPNTADGKALRKFFRKKLNERLLDVLKSYQGQKQNRKKLESAVQSGVESFDMSSSEHYESLYVEEVLSLIQDDKKRLAFRLYMEGVPVKSKDESSISDAIGKSDKTIHSWIKEIQSQLKLIVEKQS